MTILSMIASYFGGSRVQQTANSQALIVEVQLPAAEDNLFERLSDFEERLVAFVEHKKYGQFDGNEIAVDGTHARFFMYAPSADIMLDIVARPFLEETLFKDALFQLDYGVPGDPPARQRNLTIEQLRKMYDVK